jgi:hypothetical protein
MLLVLIAAAAIGIVVSLVFGSPFGSDPVSKADIEHEVSKKPKKGHVALTLCNQELVPGAAPPPKNVQTWTCDTYIGPNQQDAQNGPSYAVTVKDGDIESIRQVPVH